MVGGEEEKDSYWVRKGDVICVLYTRRCIIHDTVMTVHHPSLYNTRHSNVLVSM